MAIRLRRVDGVLVALCAARSVWKPDDRYLDDEEHMAVARKFWADYPACGIDADPTVEAITQREESDNPNRGHWEQWFASSDGGH